MMTRPPGKTKAIIAYLTFIGLLIAYYMNRDEKHEFTTWHIKNMFGLILLLLLSQLTQAYVDLRFGEILWFLSFALWLFSLIRVIANHKEAIPYLSKKFQQWFTFLN
tara:strand:- start:55412 stop:55732 length:321 start_codon:yes stop_codon:yes gene_type:complete